MAVALVFCRENGANGNRPQRFRCVMRTLSKRQIWGEFAVVSRHDGTVPPCAFIRRVTYASLISPAAVARPVPPLIRLRPQRGSIGDGFFPPPRRRPPRRCFRFCASCRGKKMAGGGHRTHRPRKFWPRAGYGLAEPAGNGNCRFGGCGRQRPRCLQSQNRYGAGLLPITVKCSNRPGRKSWRSARGMLMSIMT